MFLKELEWLVIYSNEMHTSKAFLPIEVIEEGIEISTKDSQPSKVLLPIEVIDKEISICFKLEHPFNELDPIEMTEVALLINDNLFIYFKKLKLNQ